MGGDSRNLPWAVVAVDHPDVSWAVTVGPGHDYLEWSSQ